MSSPGWYPDPAGSSGLFRYWDGNSWSNKTTTDPSKEAKPTAESPSKGSKSWLVALVAILLITALIVWIIIQSVGGNAGGRRGKATEDWNTSTPSVSSWDETTTPTPPPTGGSEVACPRTKVTATTRQRNDGKIRGGGLVMDRISSWDSHAVFLQWVSDLHGQTDTVYSGWMSNTVLGALNFEDGFTDPRLAATQTVECFASSGYYTGYTGREDLLNESITVDGRPGWRIRANVYVKLSRLPQVKGDVIDVIVVDMGSEAKHLGVFVSSVTIDDSRRQALVDKVIASIRVG